LTSSQFSEIADLDYNKLMAVAEAAEAEGDEDKAIPEPQAEDDVMLEENIPGIVEVLVANVQRVADLLAADLCAGIEIPMTYGGSIKPLGETKLRLVELVLSALKADSDLVNKAVFQAGVIPLITDLFFTFVWNSHLHFLYD
jgi:hypothetical protein